MTKLELEAPFHKYCNAGRISYIECDGMPKESPQSIEKLIRWAFTNTDISYVGVNFGIRYCIDCGQEDVKGNQCPSCGSTHIQEVDRVTGYLSLKERFGYGKLAELENRVPHM